MRSSGEFFVRALRRPLKQFETGNPLGRAKKTRSKIGTAAVAYIALPAPRGLSSGGAAPASAGAGFIKVGRLESDSNLGKVCRKIDNYDHLLSVF